MRFRGLIERGNTYFRHNCVHFVSLTCKLTSTQYSRFEAFYGLITEVKVEHKN